MFKNRSNLRKMATIVACLAVCAVMSCGDDDGDNTVAVTDITVSPKMLTLAPGAKQTLTAIVEPEEAATSVTWTSSNAAAATVNAKTGEVTAVAADKGTAIITATAGGKSDVCIVTVSAMKTFPEILSYFQDDYMIEWKDINTEWEDQTYRIEMELRCAEGYIYLSESDHNPDPKDQIEVVKYIDYAKNEIIVLYPNNPEAFYLPLTANGYVYDYFHGYADIWQAGVKHPMQYAEIYVLVGDQYFLGKSVGATTMLGRPVTHYEYSYIMDNKNGEFWLDDATGAAMKVIEKQNGKIVRTREILQIKVGGVKLIDGLDISQYKIRPKQN